MISNKVITIPQITMLAQRAGYEPQALRAVLEVESSGIGFSSVTGRLIIQFEPAWFKRQAKDWKADTDHVIWLNNGIGNQTQEWAAFNDAWAVDSSAAMLSTSIGLAQIMGFHYAALGFKTVGEMWDYAKISEANQVDMLIRFLKSNGTLDRALKAKAWATFAYYYNGAGYKALAAKDGTTPYDQRMAKAYALYVKQAA
jgi:hypothetical protein